MSKASPSKDTSCPVNNPIHLADTLSVEQEHLGNTPRPSKIQANFLQGMRFIANGRLQDAEKSLANATAEAQHILQQTKDQGTKEDKEKMAWCCFGMGYLTAHQQDFEKSAVFYKKGLQYWKAIHGKSSYRLLGALSDMVVILSHAKLTKEAEALAADAVKIAEKKFGAKSTQAGRARVSVAIAAAHSDSPKSAKPLFESAIALLEGVGDLDSQKASVYALKEYFEYLKENGDDKEASQVEEKVTKLAAEVGVRI